MTCIVGITNGDNVWMGSDSCISSDNCKWELGTTQKIIRKKDILIGVTGNLRGLQLLEYQLDMDEQPQDMSDASYICHYLVSYIKNIFFDNQYCITSEGQESHDDNYLIGYRGRLYTLSTNYSIFAATNNFMCIGSGAEYAYGALRVQEMSRILLKDPEETIKRTINVVSEFCPSVGGEVKVFNT